MTTILFFGGVLGVDRCASVNGCVVSSLLKLLEIEGRYFAISGNIAHVAGFCRRVVAGKVKTGLHDGDGVAVELMSSSRLRVYAGEGHVDVDPESFYSVGSGSEAALGAMHAGACLADCLKIASKVDGRTRGPYDLVRYDNVAQKFIAWSTT